MSEPTPKRSGQREKILTWLRMRGAQGVLNIELNEICMRFGARIYELRKAGYDIKTVKLDDSRFRFVLEEEKPVVYFSKATQMTFLEDVTWRPIA